MSFAHDEHLQETAGVFPDIDLEYQDQWVMVVADSAQDFFKAHDHESWHGVPLRDWRPGSWLTV